MTIINIAIPKPINRLRRPRDYASPKIFRTPPKRLPKDVIRVRP